MMRTRSSAPIPIQPSISARLRPQPVQSAEIGSTAHTLLQGLSMSVMSRRADVVGKIKIAARKANSVTNRTSALPRLGRRLLGAQPRPPIGERLTGGQSGWWGVDEGIYN